MTSEKNIEETVVPEEKPKVDKRYLKFKIILTLLIIGFIVVLSRLFIIQVLQTEKYKKLAKRQQERTIPLTPERGNIYDRNGKLLSSTVYSLSIAIDKKDLLSKDINNSSDSKKDKKNIDTTDYKKKICSIIEHSLGIPFAETMNKIDSSKSPFIWIARGLPYDKYSYLDTVNCRGLVRKKEAKRNYLFGSIGSQIIGCTNIDNKGIIGVEKKYDNELRGCSGSMLVNLDARGKIVPSVELPVDPAKNGSSVNLTIDIMFQNILEHELMLGVINSKAVSGTAVAIDPSTGEILAMASYPSFDPNNIKKADSSSFNLKAITDTYEPGSTFKMITASAALEEKIVAPTDIFDGCNGVLRINDYTIHDSHPIGKVTFAEAIEESSNIIFSTVANMIKDYQFYKYVRDFGFGMPLGIDLQGEAAGKIKKPEKLDPTTKRFLGFGYGISVTPLQMLSAYATIANHGILMKPYIIKSITDDKGYPSYESKPEKIRQVVSKETCDKLTTMLIQVIEGKNGTGKLAKIDGLKIAGKTGTSKVVIDGKYSDGSYNASFAGFFPVENPRVAMLILLDRPQGDYYGGQTAAPIFKKIVARWAAVNPNILKTDNNSYTKHFKDTIIVPSLVGMKYKDAKSYIEQIGLLLKQGYDENSIIISQSPKCGAFVPLKSVIDAQTQTKNNPNDNKNSNLPEVKGLTSRRAVNLLYSRGYLVKIHGSGIVYNQLIQRNKQNQVFVEIYCK